MEADLHTKQNSTVLVFDVQYLGLCDTSSPTLVKVLGIPLSSYCSILMLSPQEDYLFLPSRNRIYQFSSLKHKGK